MFQTRTLLKLLAVMEEDLDVNRFAAGRLHFWPALRFLLATKIQDNDQSKPRPPQVLEIEQTVERRFEQLLAKRPPQLNAPAAALAAAPAHAHAVHDGGIVLISRSEDHNLKTPTGYYAPVMDPWAALAANQWPCVKAELVAPKFNDTQPRDILTLAMVGHASSQKDKAALAERDSIVRASRIFSTLAGKWLESELGIGLAELPDALEQNLNTLWLDKQVYRELFLAARPGLVITSCYYFRPTIGAVWAARELGIPVADAQHGGNGEYHIGYTHWRNIPPEGYLLLPDYFFVWDNISANNLLRWFPPQTTVHRPLITGRFGLGHAQRAVFGDADVSPMAVIAKGSEKVVLVTLQTLPSTGLTPMLLEAMRQAPTTWTWLVRGHPMAQAWGNKALMPEALEATMKEAGIARYESQLSTSLPLAAILPYVNHHVTGFSGTVQECAAYGIRTTFTHPTVWSFFGNYIDIGVGTFVKTAEEIVREISENRPLPDLSNTLIVPRDDATAQRVLSQILTPVEGA